MKVTQALFVPTAEVDKSTYWTASGILIIVGLVIAFLPMAFMNDLSNPASIMMATLSGVLVYALIYPWFCVIGGRLRDSGNSPWFYLLALLGYVILASILSAFLIMPEMVANMQNMVENIPTDGQPSEEQFEAVMEMQMEMMKSMIPKQAMASTIASILVVLPFGFLSKPPIEDTFS